MVVALSPGEFGECISLTFAEVMRLKTWNGECMTSFSVVIKTFGLKDDAEA